MSCVTVAVLFTVTLLWACQALAAARAANAELQSQVEQLNAAGLHWKGLFEAQQAEAVKGNDV